MAEQVIIPIDIKEYAQKVAKMRTAQNNFFKAQKAKYAGGKPAISPEHYMKQSKALEAEVDKLTIEIILGQTQGNLF